MENAARRSRWARWSAFIMAALIGLAVRLPQLGARPMHTDEAVNAYIVGQVLAGEAFTYDSQDRHGPALAAFALPLARVQGAKSFSELTESELRLTSVVAGTATILLFGAAVEIFGFAPSLLAALLFAIAPLPVYYDRYFIHESLFCAATFALILSGWRACKRRSLRYAALAGACAALMLSSKETAFIHLFALAAAGLVFWFWNRRGKPLKDWVRPQMLLVSAGAFFLLFLALFTWFGRNWKALNVLQQVPLSVLSRSAGQGHQKPFWYFAQLLTTGWSGGLLLAVACIGFMLVLRRRGASPYGFLAIYSILIAAIYSLIPYKTPWLALNFWLPIGLFAGFAINALWRLARRHTASRFATPVFVVLCGVVLALIARDTRQRVFVHPADESNPYAYAHTSEDILALPGEIADFAVQENITNPRISVIASDPWPLPWYLRRFKQVGFWQPGQQPTDADFYVTSTDAAGQYSDRLRNYRPDFFGVRPGVLVLLWFPAPK